MAETSLLPYLYDFKQIKGNDLTFLSKGWCIAWYITCIHYIYFE